MTCDLVMLGMRFKYGSLLGTAFSAALLVGQGVTLPKDIDLIEPQTSVMHQAPKAFENHHMQLAMLERRRLLYEARSNTLIMTNMAVSGHQEVATAPQLNFV